jgi:AcrR family transcriptional regulator
MDQPKIDRRVSRTRRQLREALMELILEKGYDNITIEEITDRADLGRTTFYLHYRDKEALLLESLEQIAEELRGQIRLENMQPGISAGGQGRSPIQEVFQHAAENSNLYKIILSGGAATAVLNLVREMLLEAAEQFFAPRLAARAGEVVPPVDSFAGYFASALLGYLTWWLDKGMPYSPDEVADLFMQLFFGGAGQFLQAPAVEIVHP